MLASTTYPSPRNPEIFRAFVGDSTITRRCVLAFATVLSTLSCLLPTPRPTMISPGLDGRRLSNATRLSSRVHEMVYFRCRIQPQTRLNGQTVRGSKCLPAKASSARGQTAPAWVDHPPSRPADRAGGGPISETSH